MLLLRRANALLGTDAERGVASLHAPDLRVYVAWMSGGQRFDSGVLGLSPKDAMLGEGAVCIQLGGELGMRVDGRERPLRDGDLAAFRVRSWDERWEGPFRALMLEWTDPSVTRLPTLDVGRPSASDRAAFAAFAERVERGELEGEAAAHAVTALLARLAAAGVPTPQRTTRDLHGGAPPGAQALAGAIGAAVSRLDAAPQIEDVATALGVSARHVSRRLAAAGPWLPAFSQAQAWRRYLRNFRVRLAVSFLTRRDASLAQVARSLGYGSARALLLALSQEGLPPPRVLRAL